MRKRYTMSIDFTCEESAAENIADYLGRQIIEIAEGDTSATEIVVQRVDELKTKEKENSEI